MHGTGLAADLLAASPMVAPSLLAADFGNLEHDIRRMEQAGARVLHLDVMDGHFVPNLSIGVPVVEAVRRITRLPLDVHLMISNPERYLAVFRQAGADLLTIHVEATPDPRALLNEIRALGAVPGLSLNPPTPVSEVQPFLGACDLVLVMSVMPGFGGQAFDPAAVQKIAELRAAGGPGLLLSVDGGINPTTAEPCVAAGVNLLVAGTALFSASDYGKRMAEFPLGRCEVGASNWTLPSQSCR